MAPIHLCRNGLPGARQASAVCRRQASAVSQPTRFQSAKLCAANKEITELPNKIDFHTHLLPRNAPDYHAKFGYGEFVRIEHEEGKRSRMMVQGKLFREVDDDCFDINARLADMERDAVDMQVVCSVPAMFYYWAKPEHTIETSRWLNDDLANTIRDHDDKFLALGTVPLNDPQAACHELEYLVKDLDDTLEHEKFHEFYSTAQDLGAAIFVHPWDMMGNPAYMKKYWLPWLVGMPAETALSVCSFILGGIFDKFPELKVGFAHGAGSFFNMLGRIRHGHKCRPDIVAFDNPADPIDYLGRFWCDAHTCDDELLEQMIQKIGSDKVFMGSDYPFPLGEVPLPDRGLHHRPGTMIEEAKYMTPEVTKQLMVTNTLDFLGVKYPSKL